VTDQVANGQARASDPGPAKRTSVPAAPGPTTDESRRRRTADDESLPPLSVNLRRLRQDRKLSLNDLAAGTGISASFLSLVENGKSDITIGRLTRLVEFLGVSISDLVPSPAPAEAYVVRRSERTRLRSNAEEIDMQLLTPHLQSSMLPILLEFEPGAKRAEFGSHRPGTDEFLHVISGELILEFEDGVRCNLRAGDSACYPGDRPHLLGNASTRRRCQVLCVNSPPVF
jgi:transcriptional regulator with XRE-family HTH domain